MREGGRALARAVSIIGHPALVVPASIAIVTARRGLSGASALPLGVAVALAAAMTLWSRRQVAQRRWQHIDASAPAERRRLNRVALAVLATASAIAAATHEAAMAVGLLSGALVLVLAMAGNRWLRLSQHVAFATLATVIAGHAGALAGAMLGVLTAAVAWSRLRLRRHGKREVLAGLGAGAAAGIALVAGLHALAP